MSSLVNYNSVANLDQTVEQYYWENATFYIEIFKSKLKMKKFIVLIKKAFEKTLISFLMFGFVFFQM